MAVGAGWARFAPRLKAYLRMDEEELLEAETQGYGRGVRVLNRPTVEWLESFVNTAAPAAIGAMAYAQARETQLALKTLAQEHGGQGQAALWDTPAMRADVRRDLEKRLQELLGRAGYLGLYEYARAIAEGRYSTGADGSVRVETDHTLMPEEELDVEIYGKPLSDWIELARRLLDAIAIEQERTGWQYLRVCAAPARYGGECGRIYLVMPIGRPRKYCSGACWHRAARRGKVFAASENPQVLEQEPA